MKPDLNYLPDMAERGKLSGRLAIISTVLTVALSLVVLLTGPVYQWSGMGLFSVALVPFVTALLFSITAWIRSSFFVHMIEEEEEKRLLEKRKSEVNSLLDISEDVRFTAKRSLQNFDKYIPSITALLACLLCAAGVVIFWKTGFPGSDVITVTAPKNPINLAFLCALAAVAGFIGGVFYVGQSHVREFRNLRPVGSMLILGAAVMFLSAICALLINAGKTGYDTFIEKIVLIVCCILTVEFLLNFIMEFYRPRNLAESRPVYESRFLSLFTEPGGVMRNIADSLDYQFGFQVSKTGVYGFFQKYLVPTLILWALAFWLFTSFAEVQPGDIGIRERFGAVDMKAEPLQPGVHFKLPWPFEKIVPVPVNRVESLKIGAKVDMKDPEAASIILWTGTHYTEENPFLVATETSAEAKKHTSPAERSIPPASLLEVSIPIYYQAEREHPERYAFGFLNVSSALKSIAEAEATRYFASTDFMKDISYGRGEVSRSLCQRIQNRCSELEMGVKILSVGMHDAHPPVGGDGDNGMPNVAESFQNVIAAKEEAESAVYAAKGKAVEIVQSAKADAKKIDFDAQAYKFNVVEIAKTESFRFDSQIKAYRGQPEMYRLRTYLDFLENDCKDIRKFIISSQIPKRNFLMNLEAKPSLDLMDSQNFTDFGK